MGSALFVSAVFLLSGQDIQEFPLPILRRFTTAAQIDGPISYLFLSYESMYRDSEILCRRYRALRGVPLAESAQIFLSQNLNDVLMIAREAEYHLLARIENTPEKTDANCILAGRIGNLKRFCDSIISSQNEMYNFYHRRLWIKEAIEMVGEEDYYAGKLPYPPSITR